MLFPNEDHDGHGSCVWNRYAPNSLRLGKGCWLEGSFKWGFFNELWPRVALRELEVS